MLDIISKIIAAMCIGFSLFLISKKMLNSSVSILNPKNILLLILFMSITILNYNDNFSAGAPLIIFISMIIIYKFIFQINLSKAIITMVLVYLVYFAADIIVGITISSIFGAVAMRNNDYLFIVSNLLVSTLAIIISSISSIKQKIIIYIDKIENSKYYNKFLFLLLIFIVLSLILYNISVAAKLNTSYFIDVIVMFLFFVIAYIFVDERNSRDKINEEYDRLMEYVENFENWIDEEQLNNHEHKNQLAVIRTMAKSNKKITNYINNILKDSFDTEDSWFNEIKYLPTGGIKGLLYYKLILTKKEKINVCLSVSRDIEKYVSYIQNSELNNISKLLGIYLDNAIEATKMSSKKIISIEIYPMNSNLNIVISNTYDGDIDLKKINKKGYTTKGKGHGKGLYFANKIIKKSDTLDSEVSLINDYYVQKIIIKSKKDR